MNLKTSDMMKAYFSAGDEWRIAIIREITIAIKSLKICVFAISDDYITRAILPAHQREWRYSLIMISMILARISIYL